jgi:arginyl-tRNA synthetase
MLAFSKWGKGKNPKKAKQKSDHFVGDYYVLFSQKEKGNPELLTEAQELLKKWETHDKKTLALWKKMNSWAIGGMKQTYKLFGSKFDYWFFESQFFDKAKQVIDLGLGKNVFSRDETGAIIADLEQYDLGKKAVLRADGTAIYLTNDLALTKYKFEKFGLDEAYWVVAVEQNHYFQQLFKIFELLGFGWAKHCHHLSYEMVNLPEGKMKSREGKVVDADELIAAAQKAAVVELNNRYKLNARELKKRSLEIALAAVKFHLLRVDAGKTLTFDLQKAILFEGETGPFVQYSFARAKSILRKAKIKKSILDYSGLTAVQEKELLKLLASYPIVVSDCLRQLSAHSLCQYLLELASSFNAFYHEVPVLKAEESLVAQRLALVEATAIVLANGLRLLNIAAVERM